MPIEILPFAQAQPGGTRELVDTLARTPLSKIVLFVIALTAVRIALYVMQQRTPKTRRTRAYATRRYVGEMLDAFIYAGVFVFMLIRPFAVQAFVVPSGSMWPTIHVNDFLVTNKAIYRYTNPKPEDIVVFRPPALAALPGQLDANGDMKVDFVKRCIGTPGDIIEMKKGVLYRNGKQVEEPYKTYSVCIDQKQGEECQDFKTLTADDQKELTLPSFKLVNYQGKIIPLNYTDLDANAPRPGAEHLSETTEPYQSAEPFQIIDPEDQKKAEALPAQPIPEGMYLMMGDNRNNSDDGRVWGLVPREWIIGRAEFTWLPLSRMGKLK